MHEQVVSRTVVIQGRQGLHARPADLFVKLANRFQCQIEVVKAGERVDGKSILAILTLAAEQGTSLTLVATGPDAEVALDALAQLVESNFGEQEGNAGP